MRNVRTLYTALMVLLAKATDRELARMVTYLKEENRNIRARLPERITVTQGARTAPPSSTFPNSSPYVVRARDPDQLPRLDEPRRRKRHHLVKPADFAQIESILAAFAGEAQ